MQSKRRPPCMDPARESLISEGIKFYKKLDAALNTPTTEEDSESDSF